MAAETTNSPQRELIEAIQLYGGQIAFRIPLTKTEDTCRLEGEVHRHVVPVILIHGIMGGNLRKKGSNEFAWRPNDLLTGTGMASAGLALFGELFNCHWITRQFGNAGSNIGMKPSKRQMHYSPDNTQIDQYSPKERDDQHSPKKDDKNNLPPDDWTVSGYNKDADKRQDHIPDDLTVSPFIGLDSVPASCTGQELPHHGGQKARWRGWGEVIWDDSIGYAVPLRQLEYWLGNRTIQHKATELWKKDGEKLSANVSLGKDIPKFPKGYKDAHKDDKYALSALSLVETLQIIGQNPKDWHEPVDKLFTTLNPASPQVPTEPLTEADLLKVQDVFLPVHAMAYNWLESNAESGKKTAERIRNLIKHYNDYTHMKCEKVIVLTHSMGGLVTRAMLHPELGNLQDKVLGVYHNVMPTVGAGMVYRRMRGGTGVHHPDGVLDNLSKYVTAHTFGWSTDEVQPVFGNAPSILEMLPMMEYGNNFAASEIDAHNWLQVKNGTNGPILASFPSTPTGDPLSEIYTQENVWWKLFIPEELNPAKNKHRNEKDELVLDGIDEAKIRVNEAHKNMRDFWTVHPKNSYATYGANGPKQAGGLEATPVGKGIFASYGRVCWTVVGGLPPGANRDPSTWKLVKSHPINRIEVCCPNGKQFELQMDEPIDYGEEMVPSFSAGMVKADYVWQQQGYDHAGSYGYTNNLKAALYSIIKIAGKGNYD